MTDDQKFCIKCGATLPEGSIFCPECGSSLDGSAPREPEQRVNNKVKPEKLGPVPILIAAYGILALIFSVVIFSMAFSFENLMAWLQAMIDEMINIDPQTAAAIKELLDTVASMGVEYVKNMMILVGTLMLLSGALALIAGYYANNGQRWKLCMITCIVAAVLPLAGMDILEVVLTIIGLFMAYRIYTARDEFTS